MKFSLYIFFIEWNSHNKIPFAIRLACHLQRKLLNVHGIKQDFFLPPSVVCAGDFMSNILFFHSSEYETINGHERHCKCILELCCM